MSTRGGYQINGVNMYNHWDNYPSGAAILFFNTLKKYHKIDLFSFVRANETVELSSDLVKSGQEYVYKFNSGKFQYYSVCWENDSLTPIGEPDIVMFCNDNILPKLEEGEKYEDFHLIRCKYGIYTDSQIIENAKKEFSEGERFTKGGHIGNGPSCFSDCFRWCNYLPENQELNELREKYNNEYVPIFVKAYNHDDDKVFRGYSEIK